MKAQKFGPSGWTPEQIDRLNGKTFIITGTTTGAGYEAARLLLAREATVIMLNRNPTKSASTLNRLKEEFGETAAVTNIDLDLSKLSSVREAATQILSAAPRIDALICNAAIAQVATQVLTVDGFESQLGINHFGHFLLCGLLFERIEQSSGRIVIVGSNGYKMGQKGIQFEDLNYDQNYSAWNAYAQSKLAQMMFGYELQRRIQAAGGRARAFVCHPGASRTSLIREDAGFVTRLLAGLLSPLAQSAERGAWPEVMCATQAGLEDSKYYGPTRFEMVGPVGECPLEAFALDHRVAARLWAVSEEKTGFTWSP